MSFLDHDDVWHADLLEVLSRELAAHAGASAAYGFPRAIDASGMALDTDIREAFGYRRRCVRDGHVVVWAPELPSTFEVVAVWQAILTPGQALIRRSALRSAGPFDPTCAPADDWDMWIRLSLCGYLQPLLRFVIDKRFHAGNQSSGRGLAGSEYRVRRKLRSLPGLSADQLRVLAVAHRYVPVLRLLPAKDALRQGDLYWAARHVGHAAVAVRRYLAMRY
jgi:GT2 family glycosyltransferase